MHQLSAYSTQSLAALQHLLPDLAALAVEEVDYFLINTTSPSGWPLWISSAGEELTIGFAEHHTHFGWYEGNPQEDASAAAAYIQELRCGQLVLAAWYENTEYVSSVMQKVGEPLPTLTRFQQWFQQWWRRKQHRLMREWGT